MTTPPTVSVSTGLLSGHYEAQGQIAVFKGVPYARPPLDDLRWKPPQPPLPWQGVRKAEKFGPAAFQLDPGSGFFINNLIEGLGYGWAKTRWLKLLYRTLPSPPASEDCLYLNIRTPAPDPLAQLPVMVWIHGGDHQDGASSDLPYQSNELVRHGVVLVTINYRLGLLGYLCHPELSRKSGREVSGNYGTLDQIAALRWVGGNIAAFGGDPGNITIFGKSAGGESVAHLLTSPLSRGLFRPRHPAKRRQWRANGLAQKTLSPRPSAEQAGQDFVDKLVGPAPDQLDLLRRIPAAQLYQFLRKQWLSSFYPVIDGYVLEKSPFQSFLDGDQARIPLIIGSNADEGTLLYPEIHAPLVEYAAQPFTPDELYCILHDEFGDDAAGLFDLYPGLRQGDYAARLELLGDSLIGSPARFYALQAAKTGQPVYLYFFTRLPRSRRQTVGAYHFAESPYIFESANPVFPMDADDHEFARCMGAYWSQFARTGDPNSALNPDQPPRPEWPAFTVENQVQMEFGQQVAVNTVSRAARYDLLDRRRLRQLNQLKKMSG